MPNVRITHIREAMSSVTKRANMWAFDPTIKTFYGVDNDASTVYMSLTLDSNYDGLYEIGNLTHKDAAWVGLGSAKGRWEFNDEATDNITLKDGELIVEGDISLANSTDRIIEVDDAGSSIDGDDLTITPGDAGSGSTTGGDLNLESGDGGNPDTGTAGDINLNPSTVGTNNGEINLNGVVNTSTIDALSSTGLQMRDDSGTLGVKVFDGGDVQLGVKALMTSIGGFCVKLTNRNGSTLSAGTVVEADSSNDDSFIIADAGSDHPIGILYEDVNDDAEGWVIVSGVADVLYEDNQAASQGYWCAVSNSEAGTIRTQANSPAFNIGHFDEVGHSIESVSAGGAGTNIKGRIIVHFN